LFRLLVEGFWGESFREDMQAKEVLGRREPRPSRERAEVVRLGSTLTLTLGLVFGAWGPARVGFWTEWREGEVRMSLNSEMLLTLCILPLKTVKKSSGKSVVSILSMCGDR